MKTVTQAFCAAFKAAQALVDHCESQGIVLTIEQISDKKNPAMGRYITEISVRPARHVMVRNCPGVLYKVFSHLEDRFYSICGSCGSKFFLPHDLGDQCPGAEK